MSENLEIPAPFPGVLYRRSDPTASPFVSENDLVTEGDVVALIEVMKMFNEVRSPISGRLVEFLVDDGDAVSMGQGIARIETES